MKSYFHLKRLTAVYQILSFISFVPMLISMVFIIEGKAFTLETTLTLIISIIAMVVFTKRHDMYDKQLKNFSHDYYLDKKYGDAEFYKWNDALMSGKPYTKAEIEDVPGLQEMIDREIFGDE